jgi:hypothetical protein
MPRLSKQAMAEKSEAIKNAKGPVAEDMAKRAMILQALEQHDAASAKNVEALIEASGVSGPFKFGTDVVTFRKSKTNGHYDVHPFEVKTPI